MSSQREDALRRFHARHPGATAAALARGDSYRRLAALVPAGARVLDLACGDGHLSQLLAARGCTPIGVDLSAAELALADPDGAWVCARAQELPFADGSFDAAACHLAFMLFDDPAAAVAELARVLVPGGRFVALLGGGPVADGEDVFHRFLALAQPHLAAVPSLGNPAARGEGAWRTLFDGWTDLGYERWELDLAGTADELWQFFGASYELDALAPSQLEELRDELFAGTSGVLPCRLAMYCAAATRR